MGDLLTGALGVYPILLAWRARAPKTLLARMFLNLSIDAVGGAVPVLGDIWDFMFRAHAKNLALLQSRARTARCDRGRRTCWCWWARCCCSWSRWRAGGRDRRLVRALRG